MSKGLHTVLKSELRSFLTGITLQNYFLALPLTAGIPMALIALTGDVWLGIKAVFLLVPVAMFALGKLRAK